MSERVTNRETCRSLSWIWLRDRKTIVNVFSSFYGHGSMDMGTLNRLKPKILTVLVPVRPREGRLPLPRTPSPTQSVLSGEREGQYI